MIVKFFTLTSPAILISGEVSVRFVEAPAISAEAVIAVPLSSVAAAPSVIAPV